ncbi:DUF1513 domain-containing protein [Oceanimonas baumannii]|uniref:DUF1513 domain-containing protein n=1 Tax=Oceanimonas baumannii TaxID=129578 RepID=UPI001D1954E5|nr:DUF1513 domain-containing protein [Oceanimonas baumannii]MCC4263520.1 DUF1513 domain-containing protein [Oceanimonas baumannii]
MHRRQFLQGLSAAGVLCSLGLAGCALPASRHRYLIGGGRRDGGRYVVQALNLDGSLRYELPLPARGHGIATHPSRPLAVCHARRPGSYLALFHHQQGNLLQVREADPDRHYYGHGVFSTDGKLLYTTEGVRSTSEGIIGVYALHHEQLTKVNEFSGFGLGPHEICRLPDGNLVVGVGGVHTQGRTPLNLDTMHPSLCYLHATSGHIMEQRSLVDKHLSIRHLAVTSDGEVFTGQQYRGNPDAFPPLIVRHRRGQALQPLGGSSLDWARFNHYIASIAVTDDYIAATSPPGNCYGLWQRHSGELIQVAPLPDASGAAARQGEIWLGSGQGGICQLDHQGRERRFYSPWQWDNHWSLIGE